MPADPTDKTALTVQEAEVIDVEVMDEGPAAAAAGAPGGMPDFSQMAQMAPELIVGVFREMLKSRLKRWLVRNAIYCTVLYYLAFVEKYGWARVCFGIWLFIASLHLALLLYGWYASGKKGAQLAKVFAQGGMGGLGGLGGMNQR
jgi:hypothetical protein